MIIDPYQSGMLKNKKPYYRKLPVKGEFVAVLSVKYEKRGLKLIPQLSRVVETSSIHEILITNEVEAENNGVVNKVAGLGFVEFKKGGVIVKEDKFLINSQLEGKVLGFDETHMPNHLNIIILASNMTDMTDGKEKNISLGDKVSIVL
jgi:hypothetical protein